MARIATCAKLQWLSDRSTAICHTYIDSDFNIDWVTVFTAELCFVLVHNPSVNVPASYALDAPKLR